MKFHKPVFALAITLLLAVAGGPAVAEPAHNGAENAEKDIDVEAVQEEMEQAAGKLRDYSLQQRDQANEAAKTALDRLNHHINELEKQITAGWQEMSEEERERRQEALAALREQRAEVKKAWRDMKNRQGEAWEQAREGFGNVCEQARKKFDELMP